MIRDELIEAGYVALIGVRVEDDLGADPKGDAIEAILNAVEPLIRADERERDPLTKEVKRAGAEAVLADLRAKVEARRDIASEVDYSLALDWVLALLDGSN